MVLENKKKFRNHLGRRSRSYCLESMKIQNGPFALQMSQVLEFANALKNSAVVWNFWANYLANEHTRSSLNYYTE